MRKNLKYVFKISKMEYNKGRMEGKKICYVSLL